MKVIRHIAFKSHHITSHHLRRFGAKGCSAPVPFCSVPFSFPFRCAIGTPASRLAAPETRAHYALSIPTRCAAPTEAPPFAFSFRTRDLLLHSRCNLWTVTRTDSRCALLLYSDAKRVRLCSVPVALLCSRRLASRRLRIIHEDITHPAVSASAFKDAARRDLMTQERLVSSRLVSRAFVKLTLRFARR